MYRTFLFSLAILIHLDLSQSAHAYLDPGTGSMLLQLVLGGVAGAAVVVRLYWARVKGFFSHQNKKKDK